LSTRTGSSLRRSLGGRCGDRGRGATGGERTIQLSGKPSLIGDRRRCSRRDDNGQQHGGWQGLHLMISGDCHCKPLASADAAVSWSTGARSRQNLPGHCCRPGRHDTHPVDRKPANSAICALARFLR
jgi:hypothetical protein